MGVVNGNRSLSEARVHLFAIIHNRRVFFILPLCLRSVLLLIAVQFVVVGGGGFSLRDETITTNLISL